MNTLAVAVLSGVDALLCFTAIAVLGLAVLNGPRVAIGAQGPREPRWAITGDPAWGARGGIIAVLVGCVALVVAPDQVTTTITRYVLVAVSVVAVALLAAQVVDNVHRNGISSTTEGALWAAAVVAASSGTFLAVLVSQTRNRSVDSQAAAAVQDPSVALVPLRWAVTAAVGVAVVATILATRSWLSRHGRRRRRRGNRRPHATHARTRTGSNVRDTYPVRRRTPPTSTPASRRTR